jgi:glycosyltransferase involved in cell wall biosynthesis
MNRRRLLYLGSAFPPGVAGLFPEEQPAGHLLETSVVQSLAPWLEVRSVGTAGIAVEGLAIPPNPSPGLPNELNLLDKWPEVFHRHRSLARLKRAYRTWEKAGWRPDAILVYNLPPIYNGFIRWLKRRSQPAPPAVLFLADSLTLGSRIHWFKAFRYRFKPLIYPEAEMLPYFQACVGLSVTTEGLFAPRGVPWLWLPNGVDERRAIPPRPDKIEGPIRFGYFGSLGEHAGLPAFLKVFAARDRNATMHICGYGKARAEFEAVCAANPRLRSYSPRSPDECLQLAQEFDVLVNPRPLLFGNENNFPSKVFEYGLSGRAILTTGFSGVDQVLGENAFYFDAGDYDRSLAQRLDEISAVPRAGLRRRGAAIQARLLQKFSWRTQGEKLARFLEGVMQVIPAGS